MSFIDVHTSMMLNGADWTASFPDSITERSRISLKACQALGGIEGQKDIFLLLRAKGTGIQQVEHPDDAVERRVRISWLMVGQEFAFCLVRGLGFQARSSAFAKAARSASSALTRSVTSLEKTATWTTSPESSSTGNIRT